MRAARTACCSAPKAARRWPCGARQWRRGWFRPKTRRCCSIARRDSNPRWPIIRRRSTRTHRWIGRRCRCLTDRCFTLVPHPDFDPYPAHPIQQKELNMRPLLLAALLASAVSVPSFAQTAAEDPYLWLEDVSSPKAMEWVEAHNAASTKKLEADPHYQTLYDEALAIAGAKDRIPAPRFLHGAIYNFWQDPDHLRGYLRMTSLADYRTPAPNWTTVLDIDALGKAEGKSWVLKGLNCLDPEQQRCLVSLSDGGEDAVEVREFDLETNTFVAGGFHLPRGKHRIDWENKDHLLVATDWTPGDLTPSGYPYI